MVKQEGNAEIDNLLKEIINSFLLRHTIQFFYETKDGLRPFGSGVLALIHDTHFILTASHVAGYLMTDENQLYIRVDKKKYINVIGEIILTEINKSEGIDLAYIKIDKEMLPALEKPYNFLTIDRISNHNQMLDGVNYCILGFPENNIKMENGTLETGASFYLTSATTEKPYSYYKLDKNDFFIVTMKGKGTDMLKGETISIDSRFYGLSGGGLWFLIYNLDPITNVYTIDYKLIGIMTEFKKGKYFCLIANKIHLFIDAFKVIEGFEFNEKPMK